MKDPLGHQLFESRLAQSDELIHSLLETSLYIKPVDIETHFVITGIGSSEAHAKYLTFLINEYTTATAEYRPLTAFYQDDCPNAAFCTLVVFSQGLSPNAQIALKQHKEFHETILFTSATEAGLLKAGKANRAVFLQEIEHVIRFPQEEEFTLLIRILGPLAGYLACVQFVNQHWPNKLPVFDTAQLGTPQGALDDLFHKKGCYLLGEASLYLYGQNLSYKFMEGLFLPPAPMWDFLAFSHGPFQQITQEPKPLIIFSSPDPAEQDLIERIQVMLKPIDVTPIIFESKLALPYRIIDHERSLNHLLLKAMKTLGINQKEWPGKGKDKALYNLE